MIEKAPTSNQTKGILITTRKNNPVTNKKYCMKRKKPLDFKNSSVNKDKRIIKPKTKAKLFQLPTRLPDDTP